jgi:hypothetical protein
MAGALLDSKLIEERKGRFAFTVAGKSHEAEIRRLLRENPTRGRISLSFERERDYFADADVPGEEKRTIIAHANGSIACMGSCTVRQRFVNGRTRRVGYLGGLRLDSALSGRFDIVRGGYAFFREIESTAPAEFYFTSIAADNERARQFLERGLPGMPLYEYLGEFVSVVIGAARKATPRLGVTPCAGIGGESVSRVNAHNQLYQLSPSWSVEELKRIETLGLGGAVTIGSEGCILASAALWDQRGYKQTVVRGYNPALAIARPALNFAAGVLGQPRLPAAGTILPNAFISQLTADPENSPALIELLKVLRHMASQRGMEFLTLGFASNDPRLAAVRSNFGRREYLTRLYLVRWPEFGGSASELDNRLLAPEVALM